METVISGNLEAGGHGVTTGVRWPWQGRLSFSPRDTNYHTDCDPRCGNTVAFSGFDVEKEYGPFEQEQSCDEVAFAARTHLSEYCQSQILEMY